MHPHRQTTIDRAIAGNVKISDQQVQVSNTLQTVALDYVQTYKGFNSFVQSLAIQLADRGTLSIAQMRGALNVMVAEARRIDPVYQEDTKPMLACGKYTVPLNNDSTEYRTLRVQDANWSDQPLGTIAIGFFSGPDNTRNYSHFAFVLPDGQPIVSRKYHNSAELNRALALLLVEGKAPEYGRLWAMASGRCYICGRELTTPESKAAGIGPICAENNGVTTLKGSKDAATHDRWARAQADIDELFD